MFSLQSHVKDEKTSSGSVFERMSSRYQKTALTEMESVDSTHKSFLDTLLLSRKAGRVLFTIDDVDNCDAASLVLLR